MKTVALPRKARAIAAAKLPSIDTETERGLAIANILTPVDFSPASLQAIEFAMPLVKEFGAHLHLAYVDNEYSKFNPAPLLALLSLDRRDAVLRHLRRAAKKYSSSLRGAESVHSLKGRPFEEICRLAREIPSDLIVMSTRGNTGIKHLTLGSTAERVLRYSPCPVLVVRPTDQQKGAGRNGKMQSIGFRKILVPIDFSECSLAGLNYAKALARHFGSTLVLLNSVAPQYYVTSDEYARYDLPLLMEQLEQTSREQMRDLVRHTDWKGIKVESSLQIGHPGQQICARAEEQAADVIVTATHGRTGLKHVLLGSTAEYVVRHASCPVFVVPSHDRPVLRPTKEM